ncbi:MAG: DOMON-like domain-containing protein [Cyanobacteria bacterium P01_D01_bin.1]
MAAEIFHLKPFEPIGSDTKLSITGMVTLEGTRLTIAYLLSGGLEKVAIAPLDSEGTRPKGTRRDRLWEQTCFEFFLTSSSKPTAHTPYWEFNLSPSKEWNIFSLDKYRQGKKEELAISHLPFDVEKREEDIYIDLEMDTSTLTSIDQSLWLGVSAVVLLKTGQQTFWAITHPSLAADFHHPESFVLSLDPSP